MLTAFGFPNGRLEQLQPGEGQEALLEATWIDLVDPTEDERARVEALYRQHLPSRDEVEEIEATARFFEDEDGLHIHSFFLQEVDDRPRNMTVAFTLSGERLFTLHDHDIPAFRLFRLRARREPELARDASSILLTLFETKVEELADVLEQIYTGLEAVGHKVLAENDRNMQQAIEDLALQEDLNGKVRLCLMDTQRAVFFLLRKGRLRTEQSEQAREILRDIDSLLPHSTFLFEKVNFLMTAAQGFVNIEQNQIIKIFSIAAVVFLPPTLIASMYGMNFRHMPELDWPWGYPFAVVLMILSAIAPYLFFKRRGWL